MCAVFLARIGGIFMWFTIYDFISLQMLFKLRAKFDKYWADSFRRGIKNVQKFINY